MMMEDEKRRIVISVINGEEHAQDTQSHGNDK